MEDTPGLISLPSAHYCLLLRHPLSSIPSAARPTRQALSSIPYRSPGRCFAFALSVPRFCFFQMTPPSTAPQMVVFHLCAPPFFHLSASQPVVRRTSCYHRSLWRIANALPIFSFP